VFRGNRGLVRGVPELPTIQCKLRMDCQEMSNLKSPPISREGTRGASLPEAVHDPNITSRV